MSMIPSLSQAQDTQQGSSGGQSTMPGQRDTEDHETSLDWVGLFGVLGLVGLVGPKRRKAQQARATRQALTVGATLIVGATLFLTTPARSQTEENKGYTIESNQQGKDDHPASIGWIGLIGLAGLLGLGLPKFGKKNSNPSGDTGGAHQR